MASNRAFGYAIAFTKRIQKSFTRCQNRIKSNRDADGQVSEGGCGTGGKLPNTKACRSPYDILDTETDLKQEVVR